jgi:uncharacterized RDD family membrane protein YckC
MSQQPMPGDPVTEPVEPVAGAQPAAPIPPAEPAPSAMTPIEPAQPAGQAPSGPPPAAPPPPAYDWHQPTEPVGPAPGVRFAGHGARLVAYIVDGIILTVVTGFLGVVALIVLGVGVTTNGDTASVSTGSAAGSFVILFIVLLVSLGYFPYFWQRGSTPGMRLFGLRVVRDRDGGPIGWGTAILRLIGLWISFAVFYVGVIWILIDRRRRGWHDLLAGTLVIQG